MTNRVLVRLPRLMITGMRSLSRLVSALLVCLCPAHAAAQSSTIQGTVQSAEGTGISYANVRVKGVAIGTATDSSGHFSFTLPQTGARTLEASAVGYDRQTRGITVTAGDTTVVQITLPADRVEMEETVIEASSYSIGGPSESTLSPTEAVTTPGAAGDLFRALHAFPGVTAPGDGAGLFVRGGDVTETKTLLDQATVSHPYRYDSPAGGSFGAVRPFLVDGTHFSTGGFSAQYGNALSGVLAMESKDRPQRARQYVNLGLAAASVSIDQPLVKDELGIRISGNRSFTGLLFRINGQHGDYKTVPQGADGNASLTWDYDASGQLKVFAFSRHNQIGVETTEGAYSGLYRESSTNHLYNLQWMTRSNGWTVESSASWSVYASDRAFGVLDLSTTHRQARVRVDAAHKTSEWTLRTGGTVERQHYRFKGSVPAQPNVVTPNAPTRAVRTALPATRLGAYAEGETSLLSPVRLRLGVRTDYQNRAGRPVVDPRVGVTWQFTSHTHLRAAWGLYHQFPKLRTYSEHAREEGIGAQRAQHVVVGLHHKHEHLLLRAEAYYKPYSDLVVRTGPSRFANVGTGFARGLDLFAKYGAFLETRFNGWFSYSLLRSRRTQPRDVGTEVRLETGPAPYDLTHQLTAVGKVRVIGPLRIGGTYSAVSGRPFTPVLGTERISAGGLLPIDGPIGSKRLPAYHRLDLQISYFWPFNRQQYVIFYTAVNNVFDRANAVDVTYSPDYSERRYRTTDFRRAFYVGITLTL